METDAKEAARPLSEPFTAPDYADRFVLETEVGTFADIDDFVSQLALGQPSWLVRVSMGVARRSVEPVIAGGPLECGDSLGNWQVVDRGDDFLTFAEDMGFMAYRLTYRWLASGQVSAETTVRQNSRLRGPVYCRLATPLHCRFLSRMLHNAASPREARVTPKS